MPRLPLQPRRRRRTAREQARRDLHAAAAHGHGHQHALTVCTDLKLVTQRLKVLQDLGLGYLTLSRGAASLSGGESQRVKLATELAKKDTGKTLYVLDEPTTGLHFEDIRVLLGVLNKLVDKGNTIIVIEHNLDVIKCADYLIDMGPEGGRNGGRSFSPELPKNGKSENEELYGSIFERRIKSDKK